VQIVVFSQKYDVIRERGRKFSENTENEIIMKTIDNKTLYSNLVVLDVVVLLRMVPTYGTVRANEVNKMFIILSSTFAEIFTPF